MGYDLITDRVSRLPVSINELRFTFDLTKPRQNILRNLDIYDFTQFDISTITESPYTAKVTITKPLFDRIKGWIIESSSVNYLPPLKPYLISTADVSPPDIDLHAYSSDGKHTGMNYTSGLYENEIQGAISSGDLTNGEEWIFVPKGTVVKYSVSSYDVQEYLKQHPEIDPANATMNYTTTFMEYGENPQRIQLPDGNWTVTNRTVSQPRVGILEPGITREIQIDTTTPLTNLTLSGTLGNNIWYISDVQINLTATDNEGGSGVNTTQYSFDNSTWNTYTAPFNITNEGTTTLYYYSTDNAGNIEPTKNQTIKIDKTPPEADIRFNTTLKDIKVYNNETGSEASYIVLPFKMDINGKVVSNENIDISNDNIDKGWEPSKGLELRQYTLKDRANNSLLLVLEHVKGKPGIMVKILTTQYNGGTAIAAPKNNIVASYTEKKTGIFNELVQNIFAYKLFDVAAKYTAKDDKTVIVIKPEWQRAQIETKKGMVILDLLTNKGGVNYSGLNRLSDN